MTLALAAVIGLISGDRKFRIARAPFRHAWVFPISALLQVLPLLPGLRNLPGMAAAGRVGMVAGFTILVVGLALNARTAGAIAMLVGVALNLTVITANLGRMPVEPTLATKAGLTWYIDEIREPGPHRHVPAAAGTRFRVLDDRILIGPLGQIISLGDFVLAFGAAWWLLAVLGSRLVLSPRAEGQGYAARPDVRVEFNPREEVIV